MKKDSIGDKDFDFKGARTTGYCSKGSAPLYGCNVWMKSTDFVNGPYNGEVEKDAELNTYLNREYYNTLSLKARNLIEEHIWTVDSVIDKNADLVAQILSENSQTWTGNIALMSVSDFLKANNNTEQCGNYSLNYTNYSICKTTNWIFSSVPSSGLWTVSPRNPSGFNNTSCVRIIQFDGGLNVYHASSIIAYGSSPGTSPTLYLKSSIKLKGKGTENEPYQIVEN